MMHKFERTNSPTIIKTGSKHPPGGVLTLNVAENRILKDSTVPELSPFETLPIFA